MQAFFQLLKKQKREGYEWGAECKKAFQELKQYLALLLLLPTLEPDEQLIWQVMIM